MQKSIMNPEKILQRLDWTVIRRLDGLLQGDYRTLFHGFGLDLADIREYQFSDDVRRIDWNVTARMQSPYVRQYIEDREVTAWFLLDFSSSVDFGTTEMLKRNVLIDFVAVLARLLVRHGNRIGAIFYSNGVDRLLPAHSGTPQVLRLVKNMLEQPKAENGSITDLALLLETAFRVIKRRSLIFIVSDFISQPGWGKSLSMLARHHELLAIRLYDRREYELPDIGPVVFEDSETGEQMYVDTHDSGFRRRFFDAAQRREYELNASLRHAGVDTLALSTDGDLVSQIIRFAILRKQQKLTPALFAQ